MNLPRVTKWILGLNCGIWLLCSLMPLVSYIGSYRISFREQYLALRPATNPLFMPWQVVTYAFMHAGFTHLLCNMFAVFMFGPMLEQRFGEKRFLLYYFVCAIGAALVQLLVWYLMGQNYGLTVGASGAVFGLLFAFGYFFPDVELYLLFIPIPIRARTFVIGYAVVELLAGLGDLGGFTMDNVAHFAHLGGLLFGWVLLAIWHYIDHHGHTSYGGNHAGFHYQPSV